MARKKEDKKKATKKTAAKSAEKPEVPEAAVDENAEPENDVSHDNLYTGVEGDPKSLHDVGDQLDIRQGFDDLVEENRTFQRGTWDKSQQLVARGFPMVLLAEDNELACLNLRHDYKSKVTGDITFKKNDTAEATVGKIFAYDDRRQASSFKKVFEGCLKEYKEQEVACETD